MSAPKNLFLIRHAQSLTNADHQLKIAKDFSVPLTDKGIEQSKELGRKLFEEFIDGKNVHNYVFSSPYRRAQQTAQHFIETALKGKHTIRHPGFEGDADTPIAIHGPTIIPDLMEREIQEHPLIIPELKHIDGLPGDERFFYRSQYIESACNAASRMQRAIYDIRSWSRSPRHKEKPQNIFIFSHSLAIEAWEYLEEINNQNDEQATDASKKIFPIDMPEFGVKRRLKNAEYRLFQYYS